MGPPTPTGEAVNLELPEVVVYNTEQKRMRYLVHVRITKNT
jgi:hypothetical protein